MTEWCKKVEGEPTKEGQVTYPHPKMVKYCTPCKVKGCDGKEHMEAMKSVFG